MKKCLSVCFVIFGSVFLGGCSSSSSIRQAPTARLCVDYMTFPSANIWQSERADELARRGADCNPYLGVAASRSQADRAFEASLENLANSGRRAR